MDEDSEMTSIYSSTLDILENYTDDLARGGPEAMYGLVLSLGGALKQVERAITALQMRPYLEKSNERLRMSSQVVEEERGVAGGCSDVQAPDQECEET